MNRNNLPRLWRFELRWLHAALGAMFPPSPRAGISVGICDMAIDEFFAEIFAEVPKKTSFGIRAALWVIALTPILVIGRPRTIAGLGPIDRERVLTKLTDSRFYLVRQLVMILKTFGSLLYGRSVSVRERIGGGLAFSKLDRHSHATLPPDIARRRQLEVVQSAQQTSEVTHVEY